MDIENKENNSSVYTQVPAKITKWSRFKSFMSQDIDVGFTPKQEKVFKEVRNFWTQEIYFDKGFHLRPGKYDREENQGTNIKISL